MTESAPSRRAFLSGLFAAPMAPVAAAVAVAAGASTAAAQPQRALSAEAKSIADLANPAVARRAQNRCDVRTVSFVRSSTGEFYSGVYFQDGVYVDECLEEIGWILRDVRVDKTAPMAPALIDLLSRMTDALGGREIVVTSGFRTHATNARLRRGGAAKNSLHTKGEAVDFYTKGVAARRLARLVAAQHMGGVGAYPRRGFVHMDVGPIRYWRG